jgi:hypothetical protein
MQSSRDRTRRDEREAQVQAHLGSLRKPFDNVGGIDEASAWSVEVRKWMRTRGSSSSTTSTCTAPASAQSPPSALPTTSTAPTTTHHHPPPLPQPPPTPPPPTPATLSPYLHHLFRVNSASVGHRDCDSHSVARLDCGCAQLHVRVREGRVAQPKSKGVSKIGRKIGGNERKTHSS